MMIAVKCCQLPDSQPKMSFSHVRVRSDIAASPRRVELFLQG